MQTIHSTKLDTTHSVAVAKAKAIYHICDLRYIISVNHHQCVGVAFAFCLTF